jgi:aminocarboxymuconate-semialdehyde decarboxylase
MRKLGFTGVEILTNVVGKELSDPAFAPFWQKAEELGALVMIHPNGFTDASRLTRFYFNNVIGNPLETTIALHYLIFDGVLERHPRLKILAVHGGGYLGAYSGRIDHAWGARSDSHGALAQPPTAYLKRIYVDTVVFAPEQLAALVGVFGLNHVLLGTDYPYDMAEYDPIGHIAAVENFDAAAIAALAGGNAKKLLGLWRKPVRAAAEMWKAKREVFLLAFRFAGLFRLETMDRGGYASAALQRVFQVDRSAVLFQ